MFIDLQRHLDIGQHLLKPQRESAYDEVNRKWADLCNQVSRGYIGTGASSSSYSMQLSTDEPVAEPGWAFKKGKRATRFSDKVRSYLKGIFLQGEESGNKANAANVASKMKSACPADGKTDVRPKQVVSSRPDRTILQQTLFTQPKRKLRPVLMKTRSRKRITPLYMWLRRRLEL